MSWSGIPTALWRRWAVSPRVMGATVEAGQRRGHRLSVLSPYSVTERGSYWRHSQSPWMSWIFSEKRIQGLAANRWEMKEELIGQLLSVCLEPLTPEPLYKDYFVVIMILQGTDRVYSRFTFVLYTPRPRHLSFFFLILFLCQVPSLVCITILFPGQWLLTCHKPGKHNFPGQDCR